MAWNLGWVTGASIKRDGDVDLVNKCWPMFLDPPDPSTLCQSDEGALQRGLLSIECANKLNEALQVHHEREMPEFYFLVQS